MNKIMRINVIGGGLAGSEASLYLARHDIEVHLYEMRPSKDAPAHHTSKFGELVCSNSLKSMSLENAAGLLKEEMKVLNSIVIESAYKNQVPAGQALAVDREGFSNYVDNEIRNNKNIIVHNEEVTELKDNEIYIIATGPLTSPKFSKYLQDLLGVEYLSFYDASAPLIKKSSIDFNKAYFKSRYDKGDSQDYINCPFNEEQFDLFYNELINAKKADLHEFEKNVKNFEACMPIEKIASRGPRTLLFGPMKPVGLNKDGIRQYAVVQLRRDDKMDETYNIVGFQTNLTFPEQKRVFSLIPGLENAEFLRYGVMHKNIFINSPKLLDSTLQLKKNRNIFFAGQITGVEGYIESAATGIVAGINALKYAQNKELVVPPNTTVLGSLLTYISTATISFQPMNANYGILLTGEKDKLVIAETSLKDMKEFKKHAY